MKTEEFRRKIVEEEYLSKWCDEWTWNEDGSVDAVSVWIKELKCEKLPIKFRKVTGSFSCRYVGLKTLEGVPKIVTGEFDCAYNQLENLDYSPKKVGRDYLLYGNEKDFSWFDVTKRCFVKGKIYT